MDRNGKVVIPGPTIVVALRKESVDRNGVRVVLPATTFVALRKESVDRNKMSKIAGMYEVGRSPQGERG